MLVTLNSIAGLLYLVLMRMGLRVPEDISPVSFGGSFRGGVIAQRLTAVVVDAAYAPRRATAILDDIRAGIRPMRDAYS